jgi:V/A-type H+-transporting ATPase subunit F
MKTLIIPTFVAGPSADKLLQPRNSENGVEQRMVGNKIVVIGDRDTVTGFQMVGASDCAIPTTPEETRTVLTKYFRDPNTGLILITEPLAKPIEATLMELSEAPVPVILLIPDRQGTTGAYEDVLRELIRRAVGVDIKV